MDLGSGIRKKPIPDPRVKKAPDPGSQIPDADPQHWASEKEIPSGSDPYRT
jgi:hypothetical protein